jgi:hypothetical protein
VCLTDSFALLQRIDSRKSINWLSQWSDVGGKDYPVYRPTKKVSKTTPLTVSEIDPHQLKEQIALKQVIRGKKNLPPFESR